jgi:hypothetical protein
MRADRPGSPWASVPIRREIASRCATRGAWLLRATAKLKRVHLAADMSAPIGSTPTTRTCAAKLEHSRLRKRYA